MFRAWCKKWECEVLIWASSLEGVTNTSRGVILSYKCSCGDHTEMLTGAASPKTVVVHAG